jgi:hypothetical protein
MGRYIHPLWTIPCRPSRAYIGDMVVHHGPQGVHNHLYREVVVVHGVYIVVHHDAQDVHNTIPP